MSLNSRKPLKGISVGDKIKTKDLLKNGLFSENSLMREVKNWVVEEITKNPITMRSGKKGTKTKRKTLIVLSAKSKGKVRRCRTFWID